MSHRPTLMETYAMGLVAGRVATLQGVRVTAAMPDERWFEFAGMSGRTFRVTVEEVVSVENVIDRAESLPDENP